jgi:uncharacterized protein (DUF111 family)
MLYIDAREGLSGDMLVAAMIGLLEDDERTRLSERIREAALAHGLEFELLPIEESGEAGLGISYREPEPLEVQETSYDQCFSVLAEMERRIGSDGPAAEAILRVIFEAEGQAHSLPPEEVHLHEIARPQALLNIAAIGHLSRRLIELAGGPFICSTITTGRGIVVVSHGAVRVPPPASLALLTDMMHQPGDSPGERATPTGIAAVKAIIHHQSNMVPTALKKRSIGFGTKRFAGRLGRTTLLWTRNT